jgi:hypothetical protein
VSIVGEGAETPRIPTLRGPRSGASSTAPAGKTPSQRSPVGWQVIGAAKRPEGCERIGTTGPAGCGACTAAPKPGGYALNL